MRRTHLTALAAAGLLAITPATAGAAGFSSSSSGGARSFSSPSSSSSRSFSSGSSSSSSSKPSSAGGSKPVSGSKPSASSASKSGTASSSKSSSAPKGAGGKALPSASRPSSGAVAQKPVSRILPSSPSRTVKIPAGRSYARDRQTILRNPRYADPYDRNYYGLPSSPFFYLWLGSMTDGDSSNNPAMPQQVTVRQQDDDGGISPWWLLTLLPTALVAGGVGYAVGSETSRGW